jgi:glycosyltransferase involved in cell wall biosynthesis
MKIGLYGGLANNMYLLARALTEAGQEVVFIRDRDDVYPFSQPSWEDCPMTLPYERVGGAKYRPWLWQEWTIEEAKYDWQPPSWLWDPLSHLTEPLVPRVSLPVANESWGRMMGMFWAQRKLATFVWAKMQECDALVVCGVLGTLLAGFSGRPFVIWPHGSDLRLAAGLERHSAGEISSQNPMQLAHMCLKECYARSMAVGTQMPNLGGGHLGDPESLLDGIQVVRLPNPMWLRERIERVRRRELLKRLKFEIADTVEFVAFVPSRLDVKWKGHDRLMAGISALDESVRQRFHFIFSGWGEDRQALIKTVPPECCSFMPCAVGKPLVYQLQNAADFVIDQFLMGEYGSSLPEAMSCGVPVMAHCAEWQYARRGWNPPPVIQACHRTEILEAFQVIAKQGHGFLEEKGRQAHAYSRAVHDPQRIAHDLLAVLQGNLKTAGGVAGTVAAANRTRAERPAEAEAYPEDAPQDDVPVARTEGA